MKLWSWSTGDHGINRVRVCERRRGGALFLEWYTLDGNTAGRRRRPGVRRRSLRHRDRDRAKAAAEEFAATMRKDPGATLADITLQQLLALYAKEVTPTKSSSAQSHDRRTTILLLQILGEAAKVRMLNVRDWMRYIEMRRAGGIERIRNQRRMKPLNPAGDRAIEQDCKFLLAVLNWAVNARSDDGRRLLEYNPLAGCELPREHNPRRPKLSEIEYAKMAEAASQIDHLFFVLLVIAHETGHRITAITQLQWKDIDLKSKMILWRGENDKMDLEHVTPMNDVLYYEFKTLQKAAFGGMPFVFPNPELPSYFTPEPITYRQVSSWWQRAEEIARLPRVRGRGWHSLRRKFATDLKNIPLADVAKLGGWKNPDTILRSGYQQPDQDTMREALQTRKKSRNAGKSTPEVHPNRPIVKPSTAKKRRSHPATSENRSGRRRNKYAS